jgi:pimeloyl-ACP methyl ester carboxylesterase
MRRLAPLCIPALMTAGCGLLAVPEQQRQLDAACEVMGRVETSQNRPRPVVVILGRRQADGKWKIADHFVRDSPGDYAFVATAGHYRVTAFEDLNDDLAYQQGEPFVVTDKDGFPCVAGAHMRVDLPIPENAGRESLERDVDVASLQARSFEGQLDATLGQLTVSGKLAKLDEARFSQENAENGQWRPFDFIVASYAGVYFLEPHDPKKIPVLFVHGLAGTPAKFEYYISRLDRSRFQPWVYYYPSGIHLPRIADHLAQTVAKLQRRYDHAKLVVIAHSMGGLVSRGFIQRHAAMRTPGEIPLFITISTPWGGHVGAETGVKRSPIVVHVWEDMAPGSDYLTDIFRNPLPRQTAHHLLFTFNRNAMSFGASDDEAVTVASELRPAAQEGATRLYGFDDTHTGVFRNAEVSSLINKLLDGVR